MSMYIRCKRTNQTVFLYVEPTETIQSVKKKISAIIKSPTDSFRLVNHPDHRVLEDEKTVADLKIENDNIVYWVLKKRRIRRI